jgi:2-methylfumaryl-CoA isomerase
LPRQIGGGIDARRWPLSDSGHSYYWEGLNKGKKSVALDLKRPEGRELAIALATAPGPSAGIFVTNFPSDGFLSHDALAAKRPDIITARVMGWANGQSALDYTVNCAIGLPMMTGPRDMPAEPVNHVLPAWDIATGLYAATTILAAERYRSQTGKGSELRVPLGDVALAFMGHLGQIAEVTGRGSNRPRFGNDVYGTTGRDFATADGERIMLMAVTTRQWRDLIERLSIGHAISALEAAEQVDLSQDDGLRFQHRDSINAVLEAAIRSRTMSQLETLFHGSNVCWGRYGGLSEAVGNPALISEQNAMFSSVTHPSGDTYLTPGAAATLPGFTRQTPGPAPRMGEHTYEVLASVLDLPDGEISRLHDRGIVAGPVS